MLKSILVSSLLIHQILSSTFEYPEDSTTDSWASSDNYCGSDHKYQSPIDIITSTASTCPTSKALDWSLNTNIHTFKIENTGHGLKMLPVCCNIVDNEDSRDDGDDGDDDTDDSNDNPEFENVKSGTNYGVLTDIFGTEGTYCLDSFHIHWGIDDNTGSEHRMDGQQSVMEMHFVHRACKYDSISAALDVPISNDATAEPTLAVVGVLFKIGEPNLLIQKIVDQVAKLQIAESDIIIHDSDIDMFDVVPMNDDEIMGNFFHYKGSLTTPSCDPIVSWHVLETKMEVSSEQLQALRENIHNNDGGLSAGNCRGVKTNRHPVYKCAANGDDNDEQDD